MDFIQPFFRFSFVCRGWYLDVHWHRTPIVPSLLKFPVTCGYLKEIFELTAFRRPLPPFTLPFTGWRECFYEQGEQKGKKRLLFLKRH